MKIKDLIGKQIKIVDHQENYTEELIIEIQGKRYILCAWGDYDGACSFVLEKIKE